eukprot:2213808-Rhodomonas_salina.1
MDSRREHGGLAINLRASCALARPDAILWAVFPDVRALICQCWDKNPQRRPQTFTAVIQALEQLKH